MSFEGLIAVLDPDVVFRVDTAPAGEPMIVADAEAVARRVLARGSRLAPFGRPAIVNGTAGVVVAPGEKPVAAVGLTVVDGRIAGIDVVADPAKLRTITVRD